MSDWLVIAGNVGAIAALLVIIRVVWYVRGRVRAWRDRVWQYEELTAELYVSLGKLEERVKAIEKDLGYRNGAS